MNKTCFGISGSGGCKKANEICPDLKDGKCSKNRVLSSKFAGPSNYLKLNECKNGYLYHIYARNSCVGIFNKKNKSFVISRFKFDSNFLFEEIHWDADRHFGTVKPLEKICKAKMFKSENLQLKWLNLYVKDYEKRR